MPSNSARVPQAYKAWRSGLGFDEISYGAGGVRLEHIDGLGEAQVGYSVSPDGESFCTGRPGDWLESWLVIGHDTSVGDPLFVDTSIADLPVLTAMHGSGTWDPACIAVSLESFATALKEVRRLSKRRENPVELEKHPLPAAERSAALAKIAAANPGADIQFWELLISAEEHEA